MRSGAQQGSLVAAFAARILDASGEVAGAGFVVGPGQVATCAHVVSAVLGGSPEDPTAPTGRLCVDLPLLASPHESEAAVRTWRPIDAETGSGDVAILELARRPPAGAGVRVPPLYRPDRMWGHRFRVLGFPAGMQDGVWATGELRDRQGTRWLQLQTDPHGPPVAQGFSGAPVWDEQVEAVVGMTVASDVRPGGTTAYLLPIEDVFEVDPRLLPNPYRGLEPFGEEHADVFYGREHEVDRLAELLERQPVVAVVGRSGTGKSSLVRAGLLPRVRRRGIRIAELRHRPADPTPAAALDRLATGLATDAGQEVLVFADQFEELVGAAEVGEGVTPAQEVLGRLVDMVRMSAPRAEGGPSVRAVLTLRWEAMNELLTDEVVETFEHGTFSLAPMRRDQLRDAVVGPAARAPGLAFDDGLVERILDDAGAEPGQLPLVGSLLARLWEARQGGTLKTSAYEQVGGVKGAVARHAEQVVRQVAPATAEAEDEDEGEVRRLFTALARPDDGAGFVRRAVRLEALPADQQELVEPLARHRLLVVGQEADGSHTVDLAHQALIDHWPRLRRWLDDDRDFLVWRHEVDRQAQGWEKAGNDDGALLRGLALVQAEQWLERRGGDVPPATRTYVDASRRRARGEARRRRTLLSGLAVVVVTALLLGTLFVYQRRVTAREQAASDSRALATLSADMATTDPAFSVELALAAYDRSRTPEAENALFRHYVAFNGTETLLSGAQGEIAKVDASLDGRLVAATTLGGTATMWRRTPGEPVAMTHLPGARVANLDVSDDGGSILVASERAVRIYDTATARVDWEIPVAGEDVVSMDLGPDGSVALRLSEFGVEDPGTLEVWEPTDDGEARRVGRMAFDSGLPLDRILGFGPDPGSLLVEDNPPVIEDPSRVVSWDLATGAVTTVADGADALGNALTAAGVLVMCHRGEAPEPDEVVRRDLRDGTESTVSLPPSSHCGIDGPVIDAGAEVIADDQDLVVDLRTGEVTGQAQVPLETALLWGPVVTDGDRLFTLQANGAGILITEVVRDDRPLPAERVQLVDDPSAANTALPSVRNASVLPDGRHVLTATSDSTQLVVSRSRGEGEAVATVTRPAPQRPTSVSAPLAVNDDGTLLADRVSPTTIQVRHLPDLELVSEITTEPVADDDGFPGTNQDVIDWMFDRLLTYDGPHAQLWDPSTGGLVADLDVRDTGLVADDQIEDFHLGRYVDPDQVILVVLGDPEAHILDFANGREVGTLELGDDVLATQFQNDSRYFTLLRQGSLLEMWDRVAHRRVLGPLRSLGDSNNQAGDVVVHFLPAPGRYLVGDEEQLRWYEAGSAAPTRRLDLGTDMVPISASRDGSVVLYLDYRIAPIVKPPLVVDPAVWRRSLCDVIDDRELSAGERALLPPGTATHPLC